MNIDLSWDLLIIIIFSFVIGYSFIVGINRTLKIIIGIYLASLTADSLGNIFNDVFLSSPQFLQGLSLFNLSGEDETLILAKIIIFSVVTVLIATKAAFEVSVSRPIRSSLSTIVTGAFGVMSGGLMISILLVYISGLSFTQAVPLESNIATLYAQSSIVKVMVNYHNFWFSIPVIALIVWSIFANRIEEEI